MRIYYPILLVLFLGACTLKPVETVYNENTDLTRFTAKPFKSVKKSREILLVAEKECPGKVICSEEEIKLIVKHSDRFAFLKGKDLQIETEKGQIDLNQRDYSNSYDIKKLAKDGTSGVLNEKYLIWVSESDFLKAAHAEQAEMKIGEYSFKLPVEGRTNWQIMLDKGRLLEIMDKEQQREYGKYPHERKKLKEISVNRWESTNPLTSAPNQRNLGFPRIPQWNDLGVRLNNSINDITVKLKGYHGTIT